MELVSNELPTYGTVEFFRMVIIDELIEYFALFDSRDNKHYSRVLGCGVGGKNAVSQFNIIHLVKPFMIPSNSSLFLEV